MNFLKLLALGSSLAFVGSLAINGAIAAEGRPMVCRGGGTMFVTATMYENDTAEVTVGFTHAPMGAGERQLLPGTCAWPDRPIRPDEPRKLVYSVFGAARLEVRCSQGNCDVQVNHGQITELFGVATTDTFFNVIVTDNRRGAFEVRRVGR